ncbi:hypothetical protein [Novosphingobium cyanobacteriorum]|uniref:Poly(3-hydroxyalkanoate) polymerase subunit PhaE n=1 Tax=Novosphingobium cyanobacteriorum TaxID=3024215 RepID=A0ABT6CL97_9SPHN|nr:hypothetical protein [Novosphingobium cyanobacteriorum]MDF8334561.1 hypothetical protein [Novosphingobium cyanobacteriorum]
MTDKPFDPVAAWTDMVQKWEHEINSWSGKLTENEQFGAIIGQATKVQLVAQRAFGEQMDTLLRNLNLPSKAQVDQIGERLDAIEDSIDRLRLAIEALAGKAAPPAAAVKEPRRTRKPG